VAVVNRVDTYIFRQLLVATVFVAVALTCVVWLTQSLRFIEMIVNRGLSAPLFVYFTLLLLPSFLGFILPIALFAATLFTYNKLLLDSELLVLRAGGLSQFALSRPAVILAVLVTGICYAITLYFMPASYREFKDLQFTLRNSLPAVVLQEGVFNNLGDGLTVYVRERAKDGELFGIIVHDERSMGRPVTMMAERGVILPGEQGPRVVMANGNRQEVGEKDGQLSLLYFDRYSFDIGGAGDGDQPRWREPRERFLPELFLSGPDAQEQWNYTKLRMEGHHRLASPLLPLSFTLVALALLLHGDFNRRGQTWRILAAVGIVLLVEAAVLGLRNLGERLLEIVPLLYAAPLAPAVIAIWILAPRRRLRRPGGAAAPVG
jgi:lipopolysaccharide export system permease protein